MKDEVIQVSKKEFEALIKELKEIKKALKEQTEATKKISCSCGDNEYRSFDDGSGWQKK